MKFGFATLAALTMIATSIPAFAATEPKEDFQPVPRSVIQMGPVATSSDWFAPHQAELRYLHTVCPTVMQTPKQYSPTLVRFCQEVPPA